MPDRPEIAQPWCLKHEALITDLKHEVFGNGKPGLKADMQDMKTTLRVSLWWIKGVAIIASLPTFWKVINFMMNNGLTP